MNGHGTICEGIASIHEQRTTIHATPSFPLTRDATSA
jgi:hypothetical protein